MNMAWTYSGHSVSLLQFVDETNRQYDFIPTVYRTAPKQDPDTKCRTKTTDLPSIPRLSWVNQELTNWRWKRFLETEFDHTHDVLLTENILGPSSIAVANRYDVPSIFFVRSILVLGLGVYDRNRGLVANYFHTDIGGKIQFPFLYATSQRYATAMEAADVIVANSEFTANCLSDQFNVETEIIYPPISLEEYQVPYNPGGKITMVNPRTKYKGADIFLDIAERLPEEEFLVAGSTNDPSIEQRIEELDNVTYLGWQDDMSHVYQQAKLVVVPSRIQEAFGRVAAEAMASGIPCVVSDRGGLPEVVGDLGQTVTDIESVEAWVDAIQTALNEDSAADRSDRKQHVEKFSMDRQVTKLFDLIDAVVADE